jgi:anti-sigma regulatory factor (Ser/Thr protein kinase)
VEYRVRDGGPGFSRAEAEDRQRRLDWTALHGRGLMLIRHYMHRVEWNATGNEISMSRRIPVRGAGADAAP